MHVSMCVLMRVSQRASVTVGNMNIRMLMFELGFWTCAVTCRNDRHSLSERTLTCTGHSRSYPASFAHAQSPMKSFHDVTFFASVGQLGTKWIELLIRDAVVRGVRNPWRFPTSCCNNQQVRRLSRLHVVSRCLLGDTSDYML